MDDFKHIIIKTNSGKEVLIDENTKEVMQVSGSALDVFEKQEVRDKLAVYEEEKTMKQAYDLQEDPSFRKVRDRWEYERDPEDLARLNSDAPYLLQEFAKTKAELAKEREAELREYGPDEEETLRLEEEKKVKKAQAKEINQLKKVFAQKKKAGHSPTGDEEALLAELLFGDRFKK